MATNARPKPKPVKGLSAKQLNYYGRVYWRKTAALSDVRLGAFKRLIDKKTGNLSVVAVTYSLKDANGVRKSANAIKRHKTTVTSQTGLGGKLSVGPVKVSCSCESFLFHCEHHLYRANAADLIYGNGKPIVKGPTAGVKMALCKHLVVMTDKILARGI